MRKSMNSYPQLSSVVILGLSNMLNIAGDCQDRALAARNVSEHGEVAWQAGPALAGNVSILS